MDVVDLQPAVERLEENIDALEETLQKLLGSSLEETSRKLPLLDRAKLHVLVTYTLESLLHSYLRLHGVDAKDHPINTELTRLKQYFAKIENLEKQPEKRTMALDQGAARRFISRGLAGNDKFDIARAEKQAKEKARAQLKAALMAQKKQSKPESLALAVATSQESSNDTPQSTSRPQPDSDSDSSSDSESEDETKEIAKDDAAKEFKDSTEYIELATDEPTGRETAKTKAKNRKEEFMSKKAEKRAKREGNQIKNEKQRDVRKEQRLKKKAMKRDKRAKEKGKAK
ncbi:uncharacterized protein TRUGW13939_11174 [Talaromyces rugulosus]|uniref:Exosome complex protein n=1 Tax=Talaromyces rugulosus TaxID=121627 RepID=A0A7H8RE68_TALRU|nr:uncharacterized protein TRUGW13939_11174 [Talaromyces rugulosus]QKX64001.1 hypothetical protein TRUGW13939_11174 [Talaromyces rugulosus]